MAWFRCSTGGAGKGADLVITCDSVFAGSTITVTDGTKTFSQQCPSSSPYEVTIKSIPTGTWTISGTYNGQTFTETVTVVDFTATLGATPEGSTVTPTDDVQIWLHCADIWDKNYTTVAQVLADSTTLLALISSNNAVDYMVRSTTFASDICADSTAMTDIGANNYCADTLLADSTWLTAICNSTYFESVLNVKVPTMTSDTTPYGQLSASSYWNNDSATYAAYKSFDGNDNDNWASNANPTWPVTVTWKNTTAYCCKMVSFKAMTACPHNFTLQGSNDGVTYHDIKSFTNTVTTLGTLVSFIGAANKNTNYLYHRLSIADTTAGNNVGFRAGQFYGRVIGS